MHCICRHGGCASRHGHRACLPPLTSHAPFLPLPLRSCLTQMGTQRRSFVDLTEYLDRTTGGVTVSPLVSAHQGLEGDPRAYIMVRSC